MAIGLISIESPVHFKDMHQRLSLRKTPADILKEKIMDLKQRTLQGHQQTNAILHDQENLFQQATQIQHSQQDIRHIQQDIEQKHKKIEHNILAVKKNQNALLLDNITLKWREIYRQATGIHDDQQMLGLKIARIEQKRTDIYQYLCQIQLLVQSIHQNFKATVQCENQMGHNALVIRQNQDAIQVSLKESGLKRAAIQRSISFYNKQNVEHLNPKPILEIRSSYPTVLETSSFWTLLLKKIIAISFTCMIKMSQLWVKAKMSLNSHLFVYQSMKTAG